MSTYTEIDTRMYTASRTMCACIHIVVDPIPCGKISRKYSNYIPSVYFSMKCCSSVYMYLGKNLLSPIKVRSFQALAIYPRAIHMTKFYAFGMLGRRLIVSTHSCLINRLIHSLFYLYTTVNETRNNIVG